MAFCEMSEYILWVFNLYADVCIKMAIILVCAEFAWIDQDIRMEAGLSASWVNRLPEQQPAHSAARRCEFTCTTKMIEFNVDVKSIQGSEVGSVHGLIVFV